MKLARTLILLLLAMFLALFSVLGVFEVRRAVCDYDENAATDLAATGRALRPAVAEVWRVEGEGRARDLLAHADADTPNVQIRWISLRTDSAAAGLDAAAIAALKRGEDVVYGRGAPRDGRLVAYVPIQGNAAIELAQPLVETHVVVLRVAHDRLLSVIVALGMAAGLSILAGVWIVGRPMEVLADQARRIGAGDLGHRLPLHRSDEIGQLAAEMNRMCDRLLEANARAAAEAEARLRTMEQLRRADRLSTVGTLASGMAHELGTPLSIISGRAKMIATRGGRASESRIDGDAAGDGGASDDVKFARIILGQTDKMTRIMRGLLDFARRKPAQKRPTDAREVARRTVELLAPLAERSNARLRVEEGGGSAIADVDVAQLEQALANLVVNGVHAMPRGGEVVVEFREFVGSPPAHPDAPEASYLCISVRDEGEGIHPADLPHVFEPFFTTKDIGEGTGLGLSVTYGIVEDHGGFVDVVSQRGEGARFSLYFPRAARDQSGSAEVSGREQVPSTPSVEVHQEAG